VSTTTTTPPLPALERVLVPAAALRAATATGLLDAMAAGGPRWHAAADLARQCGLDPHRTGVLLDVLADAALVERDAAGYRGHPDLAPLGTLMEATLGDLPAAVARDRRGQGPRDGLYPSVVRPLGALIARTAADVAGRLAAPGVLVLDLGAGAAPWSLAILGREPSARLVAVDRPEVLPATRAAIDAAGVADRASIVAADLTAGGLPGGAGLVLLAHVCHLFDDEQGRAIVRRAAASMAPGGRLAIIEFVAEGSQGERRPALLRYELSLFARTGTGRVHHLDALRAWCGAAGLERQQVHDLGGDLPMTLLIAEREKADG